MKLTDNVHFSAILSWAELHFSQFAFDLLAMMQGTYEVGRLSSFYGVGTRDVVDGLVITGLLAVTSASDCLFTSGRSL